MLILEDFKQEICCSISGLVQFLMHLLMLFKVAGLWRCEQLVSQRWMFLYLYKIIFYIVSYFHTAVLLVCFVCFLFWQFTLSIQGAAIDRILGEIVHSKSMISPIDYVLCIGHFLGKVIFASHLSDLYPFLSSILRVLFRRFSFWS